MADKITVGPNGVQINTGALKDTLKDLLGGKPAEKPQTPSAPVTGDTTIKFNEQSENAAALESYMKENRIKRDVDGKITYPEAKEFEAAIKKKYPEIAGGVTVTLESITIKPVEANALGITFKADAQPAASAAPAADKPAAPAPAAAPTGEAARLEKLIKDGGLIERGKAHISLTAICLKGEGSKDFDSGVCERFTKSFAPDQGNSR